MKEGEDTRTNEAEWSGQLTSDQSHRQKLIRVLHIDDDSSCLMFTKRFLETNDPLLVIESVELVDEALELLEDHLFDCVIADDKMPAMDGIELAHEIRKKSTIPIIFYTGKGSEEVASAAFAAGVDDYLQKDFDPNHYQVLAKRIRTAVKKHRLKELYQSVVEGSRDAIIIVIGATIVYANQAAADLIDASSPEELIGRDTGLWIAEEELKKAEDNIFSRQSDETRPRSFELNIMRTDGELRRVEVSSSQIEYEGKTATLCFIRDVTERKRMEQRLQEYMESLEKRVQEKTGELLDAERLAAADRVAAMVDHDLRSPLQTIKNAISLLRRSPEEREKILDMADDAVDRAIKILEELRHKTRESSL